MKFQKQGVGLMWVGFLLIFLLIYPAFIQGNIMAICFHVGGWVMFIAGAIIRGNQKKKQKNVENAIYKWAEDNSRGVSTAIPQRIDAKTPEPVRAAYAAPAQTGKTKSVEIPGSYRFNLRACVFLDVETTGLNVFTDRIVEIAAVRMEHGVQVDMIDTLINPECLIPKSAYEIHHIGNADVTYSPTFEQIAPRLLALMDGAPIIAHNAAFDARFIGMELDRAGCPPQQIYYVDTVPLAREAFPGLYNYKLETLSSELHLGDGAQQHRAMDDCRRVMALYNMCQNALTRR